MPTRAPDHRRSLATVCGALLASVAAFGALAYLLAPSYVELPPGAGWTWTLVAVALVLLLGANLLEKALAGDPAGPGAEAAGARAKLVGFALREASGLLGGVLTFLTGDRLFVVALGGFALLAMALAWPAPSSGGAGTARR